MSQEGDRLLLRGFSAESVRRFFALDADLPAITRTFSGEPLFQKALKRYPGLRVIRQDPWECSASFMLSAYNNIPRLTGMLEALAIRFGPSPAPTAFPKPQILAKVSERELRACGLGYRAPYLKAMARKVAAGEVDLEEIRDLGDEELRRELLRLPGIGEKVVECVMLFAYGRGSAFPVDVWIGRAMRELYFKRRKVSDKKIREFALKRFGPHCGWAQQYLYCAARWKSKSESV